MSGLASVTLSGRHIKHATLYRHAAVHGFPNLAAGRPHKSPNVGWL
jgi:hypothetical protein